MTDENKTEPRSPLRLADLMRTPEFMSLTERQQVFVARYVSGGFLNGRYNATDAAATAFRTRNPEVLGNELLGQTKIRAVLDLLFRRDPLESVLANLRYLLKRSNRRGANLYSLRPLWKRATAALEAIQAATQEKSNA